MAKRKFTEDDFLYPETDDMPTADSDLHRRVMTDLIARLEARYADAPDVYVSGDIRVYCEEWNPYDVKVPDCFVVFGVPKKDRIEYRGWAEGRMPSIVFEVITGYDPLADESKLRTYRDHWNVDELFLFDPIGDCLTPRLQGFHRTSGAWQPIEPSQGRLASVRLGLTVHADGSRLVLRDAVTGAELLPAAEAEVARLKAELAALRKRKPTA
jgi:Uma2 family endonuclease